MKNSPGCRRPRAGLGLPPLAPIQAGSAAGSSAPCLSSPGGLRWIRRHPPQPSAQLRPSGLGPSAAVAAAAGRASPSTASSPGRIRQRAPIRRSPAPPGARMTRRSHLRPRRNRPTPPSTPPAATRPLWLLLLSLAVSHHGAPCWLCLLTVVGANKKEIRGLGGSRFCAPGDSTQEVAAGSF